MPRKYRSLLSALLFASWVASPAGADTKIFFIPGNYPRVCAQELPSGESWCDIGNTEAEPFCRQNLPGLRSAARALGLKLCADDPGGRELSGFQFVLLVDDRDASSELISLLGGAVRDREGRRVVQPSRTGRDRPARVLILGELARGLAGSEEDWHQEVRRAAELGSPSAGDETSGGDEVASADESLEAGRDADVSTSDASSGDASTGDAGTDFSNGAPEAWITEARERFGIPGPAELVPEGYDGWPYPRSGPPNMGLFRGRNSPLIHTAIGVLDTRHDQRIAQIRWTLERFEEELDYARERIDVAMMLAIKTRESGRFLANILGNGTRVVCSAGRDTVPDLAGRTCRSGLDFAMDHRNRMPPSMRGSMRAIPQSEVRESRRCPRSERPDPERGGVCRSPAMMPERNLLAAAIAHATVGLDVNMPGHMRRLVFPERTEEERRAMLDALSTDGRRVWTQMYFGAPGHALAALRKIKETTEDGETPDLNRVVTDATLADRAVMGRMNAFGVHAARVRTAEAWMIQRYLDARGVRF